MQTHFVLGLILAVAIVHVCVSSLFCVVAFDMADLSVVNGLNIHISYNIIIIATKQ